MMVHAVLVQQSDECILRERYDVYTNMYDEEAIVVREMIKIKRENQYAKQKLVTIS